MSSTYGMVDTGIWKHYRFKELKDDAKLLFLYLKTSSHGNLIGCYHLPVGYISSDTGWSEKKVKQIIPKLYENGFIRYDETVEYVFLPRHIIKHGLQNPNQVKCAEKLIKEIPKTFLYLNELIEVFNSQERVEELLEKSTETQADSVPVPVPVPVPISMSGKPDIATLKETAKNLLLLLNEKANRNYQPVDANIEIIVARLKEYDEKTVRQVIVKKTREFLSSDEMKLYARPATLFNKTKFAQYSGELVIDNE